jgi:lipid-A-disaccharide synthase
MPNLILGAKKFPEFLQYDATAQNIAKEAIRILSDQPLRIKMKEDLKEVSRRLGESGASLRAAEEILGLL